MSKKQIRLKVKQKDLADFMGISVAAVAQWKENKRLLMMLGLEYLQSKEEFEPLYLRLRGLRKTEKQKTGFLLKKQKKS
jgi:transcriptional regulator with XRE-family HTH domain